MLGKFFVFFICVYGIAGQCPAGYTDAELPCFDGTPASCPSSTTQSCFNMECCTNPVTTTTTLAPTTTTTPVPTTSTTPIPTSTSTGTTGATTTAATGTTVACVDMSSSCPTWTNNGFCTSTFYTAAQKQQYCPQSCNLCASTTTTVPSTCTDSSTSCANWANNGFCTSTFYTAAQKLSYCGSTCNLCAGSATTTTTAVVSTCVDSSSSCTTWVQNQFCTNTFYTTAEKCQYCAKSCSCTC